MSGGEWLQWTNAADKPDAELTVLVFVPGGDEEVWPGYWDGEAWQWAEGVPVDREVVAWANMPEGVRGET